MHKSRLAGFIIDCRTDDLAGAAGFWGAALGYEVAVSDDPDEAAKYRALETGPDGLAIEVQRVEHESRLHLDIETDDIEAEVERLKVLGAREVTRMPRWCVMEAPTGQRFCVVSPQKAGFAEQANRWE